MRKIINLTLLVVFISSCNAQITKNNCEIQDIDKIDFLKKSEIKVFDSIDILKENSKIILPIDKGENIILTDTLVEIESPEMELYEFIAFVPEINNYVVRVTYLLDEEILFFDKENGKMNKGLRFFSVSSSGIIATYDMPDSDQYNGIRLFRLMSGKYMPLCEIFDREWFPEEIIWKSNDVLDMRVLSDVGIGYKRIKLNAHTPNNVYKK